MTKKLILGLVIGVLALPVGGAQARNHCNSPVNFLSGTGLLLNSRSVGCDGIAEDLPGTPWDDSNTDWITPGSAEGVVRFLDGGIEPVDGIRQPDGTVLGSQIEISWGNTIALKFEQGDNLDGTLANYYDSQSISIGRNNSLLGIATITVCRDEAGVSCETVVYRGVGAIGS